MPVIKQQTQFVNQPIGVSSFDTGRQEVARAVSNFANNVGQIAYNIGAQEAEKRGTESAQAVDVEKIRTIDPETGKPAALQSTQGMGNIARQAFERVVDRRFAETITNDIRLKSRELALQYENPAQYDQMFSQYLGSLTEGADGRFKNMVTEVGSFELANTKITLTDRARQRARSAAANGVVTGNQSAAEEIFDLAMDGDIDAAIAAVDARVAATSDAEQAELLRAGATNSTRSALTTVVAQGMLQSIHNNATPLQSRYIDRYIATQGRIGAEGLSEAQKTQLDRILPNIDVNNTADILNASASIQSDVNAVREIEIQMAQQEAERAQIDTFLSLGQDIVANATIVSNTVSNAFEIGTPVAVSGAIGAATTQYNNFQTTLGNLLRNETISTTQYDDRAQTMREGSLASILTSMALDGSQQQIESLKTALVTNNPASLAVLTPNQQAAVQALRASPLFNPIEDRDFVNSFLSQSVDSFVLKREQEATTANILMQHEELVNAVERNVADEEMVNAFLGTAQDNLGLITGETYDGMIRGLRIAEGKSYVNAAAGFVNSTDLLALSNYVKSNGSDDANVTEYTRSIGDAILNSVSSDGIDEVAGHAGFLQSRMAQRENQIAEQNRERALKMTVASGNGNSFDSEHRRVADKLLEEAGIDVTSPDSVSPQFYQLASNTMPQSLIDNLKAIPAGLATNNIDTLMQHFVNLSGSVSSTGVQVNRFGDLLSASDQAFLQDVYRINLATGADMRDIVVDLTNRRNSDNSNVAMNQTLQGKTPSSWLEQMGITGVANAELAPAVEYYARTQRTSDQITQLVTEIYDSRYMEDPVVVDPAFPISEQGRTRFALESMFPNTAQREKFLEIISSELPAGYYLNVPQPLDTSEFSEGPVVRAGRPVYLVPDGTTANPRYFLYQMDENNLLSPLIFNQDGEDVFPMYDRTDPKFVEFVRRQEAEALAQQEADINRAVINERHRQEALRNFFENPELVP